MIKDINIKELKELYMTSDDSIEHYIMRELSYHIDAQSHINKMIRLYPIKVVHCWYFEKYSKKPSIEMIIEWHRELYGLILSDLDAKQFQEGLS
jgi:hypothetical protein